MSQSIPFDDPNVERAFADFPAEHRAGLLELRELIFGVAARTEGVGPLDETLKWGQPAYLTAETKSGTTIRLGKAKQDGFGLFVHCQTSIMSEFQSLFPDAFDFDGNRAVQFQSADELPRDKLEMLVSRALTYHLK